MAVLPRWMVRTCGLSRKALPRASGPCAIFEPAILYRGEKTVRKHMRGTATLVITAAVALSGCGEDSGPPLSKAAFVERGSEICAEVSARIESSAQTAFAEEGKIPTASEITEFASGTVAPAIENEVERLSELRPPEDDEERVEDILEAGRDGVDRVRQDPTVILSSEDAGFAKYKELSEAYGLEDCGGGSEATRDAIEGRAGGG